MEKIIAVLGPTASGKSDLAVDLAKKFDGEIISADSRQVFKGLNIGSGKITKKEMKGIPHYLLDVVSPNRAFSVTQFKKKSDKIIKDILKRGKIPIIAGGTGFYIQSIVDNIVLPEVKPDKKLRKKLDKKTTEELVKILKKLDKHRAEEIDQKNPRRLVRAIEIATELGEVPKLGSSAPKWEVLQIGIKTDKELLNERIAKRFEKRVQAGIVSEAKKLHRKGLTWKRMKELGLAHKYIADYLRKKKTLDTKISKRNFGIEQAEKEMIENSIIEEQKYAKRQRTWFKRDKRVKWFELKDFKKIEKIVKDFLN